MTPTFYPARPVNGGPLPKAQPKHGDWTAEAKYNGWRTMVHTPTGTMFNRENKPLSITAEFKPVLDQIKRTFGTSSVFPWLDCEALERRHNHGRGSLIILDAPMPGTYAQRRYTLGFAAASYQIAVHKDLNIPMPANTLLLNMTWRWDGADGLWEILKQCNDALKAEFFEGLVAKRNDSIYPMQLRSPSIEFPFWMKHRWAF